ncbi:glucuronyl hydrolase [Sphingobacterium sp. Mn56C]|uniref:glucuronyl hydrolase n=1 Tax=Sphingobacterium sp. Mn56C TaxID=3395261 RepID=UPI003BD271C4
MNILKSSLFVAVAAALFAFQNPDLKSKPKIKPSLTKEFVVKELHDATAQYKIMAARTPLQRMPKTYYADKDSLETSNTSWWTSGFYPGTLLYLYEFQKDPVLWTEIEKRLHILEKEQFNKGTHDLGFMLYCSFGAANRLKPNPQYKAVLLQGAESLSSRYNKNVEAIRSWDHNKDKWQFPVIIDNMMNLEFLNWASRESGNPKYADIARKHSDKTIKHHFRSDFSSYHVVDYDTLSGAVRHQHTAQGFSHASAWSRGQAWGLYGYVMMYRDTRDKAYLAQSVHIAEYILNHPHLPADAIPYWDFDADNIPNAKRDASAAAIIASALLELQGYVKAEQQTKYLKYAEKMLTSLASNSYKAQAGTNGGFILKHSVGYLNANSEVDVPLSYADYYYVEALVRYKKLLEGKSVI